MRHKCDFINIFEIKYLQNKLTMKQVLYVVQQI